MVTVFRDALLSLLPRRYYHKYAVDPVGGTIVSAVAQGAIGLGVYMTLFFAYLGLLGGWAGAFMVPALEDGHNYYSTAFGMGIIGWLSFSLSPIPLLCMYNMVEGSARFVSGFIVLEPLPSLPFAVAGAIHDVVDRRRARSRQAPPAPDVVELPQAGDRWDVRITSVRKKEDWRGLVQILYNGEYYQIASSGQELAGATMVYRYYLKKTTGGEGFRGIIQYDPFAFFNEPPE